MEIQSIQIYSSPIGTLHTGTDLELICESRLLDSDVEVAATAVWKKNGEHLISNNRLHIEAAVTSDGLTYTSTIKISPLSKKFDEGSYSCHFTLSPVLESQHITAAITSAYLQLSIEGNVNINLIKFQFYFVSQADLPAPNITITSSKDGILELGDNYTSRCTAIIPETLVSTKELIVIWLDGAGNIISNKTVLSGFALTLSLDFHPLLASHGGQYICLASLTIPEISSSMNSSSSINVNVQCK